MQNRLSDEGLRKVLSCPIGDAPYSTIRSYLFDLLFTLWVEGENFDVDTIIGGKCWHWKILTALYENDFIRGERDESGNINFTQREKWKGVDIVAQAIIHLFGTGW